MSNARRETVTRLLAEVREGRRESFDRLFPLVYDELRRLARWERRGGRGGETLGTTGLVHEAYLRLVGQTKPDWRSHGHFAAVAAKAMRHILIDQARSRRAAKRGGGAIPLTLDSEVAVAAGDDLQVNADALIALDAALDRLERLSERQARIVEMRFFGGLTIDEIALTLGISRNTVKRGWDAARAWLYRAMEPEA